MTARLPEPTDEQIAAMADGIRVGIEEAARRRSRRRRTVLASAAVAVAAGIGITAAATAVPPAETSDEWFIVACYDQPRLDIDVDYNLFDPGDEVFVFDAAFALELCEQVYALDEADISHPTVCELADLRFGVFPNAEGRPDDEFCFALGLTTPPDAVRP